MPAYQAWGSPVTPQDPFAHSYKSWDYAGGSVPAHLRDMIPISAEEQHGIAFEGMSSINERETFDVKDPVYLAWLDQRKRREMANSDRESKLRARYDVEYEWDISKPWAEPKKNQRFQIKRHIDGVGDVELSAQGAAAAGFDMTQFGQVGHGSGGKEVFYYAVDPETGLPTNGDNDEWSRMFDDDPQSRALDFYASRGPAGSAHRSAEVSQLQDEDEELDAATRLVFGDELRSPRRPSQQTFVVGMADPSSPAPQSAPSTEAIALWVVVVIALIVLTISQAARTASFVQTMSNKPLSRYRRA